MTFEKYKQKHWSDSFPNYCKEFTQLFPDINQPLNRIIDETLSMMQHKPVIDILKLDDILHEVHGDYEGDHGWSMKDLINKKYGDLAMLFVESLI